MLLFFLVHPRHQLAPDRHIKGMKSIGYLFQRVAQDFSAMIIVEHSLTSGCFQLLCVFGHIASTQAILRPRIGYKHVQKHSLYFLPDWKAPVPT